MQWSGYVLSAVLGGALVVGVYASGPETTPPPTTAIHEQLAQQTALLERIATVLERWDAAEQAGNAAAAKRLHDAMRDWGKNSAPGGLDELPKKFK